MVPRMMESVTTIIRVMVMMKTVTIRMIAVSHHHWMVVWIIKRGHIDTYFPLSLLHFRHMYDGLEMSISYLKMGITLVINKVLNEGLRLI
jgi:hypothetical protein